MPSYSPKPTDPNFSPWGPDILKAEFERGYAEGHAHGLRACGGIPIYPCPAPKGESEMQLPKHLLGLFLGLFLGLLIGLFLGLFIGAKVGGV